MTPRMCYSTAVTVISSTNMQVLLHPAHVSLIAQPSVCRRLWQQVTAVGNVGGHMVMPEPTVEDLVDAVRKLPPDASAIPAVSQG